MTDNLIFYINKLSYLIVAEELENQENQVERRKDTRIFTNYVRKVRQKGCDILLNHNRTSVYDPCVTDYGGNWSPLTLITDYGRELEAEGGGKYNDLLISCIDILKEKDYNCVQELLKLLLLLKRPVNKESSGVFQNDLLLKGSDFLVTAADSIPLVNTDLSCGGLTRTTLFKKALTYEETWTKNFDSKFHVLGELSKRNLLTPDKLSLKSVLSSNVIVVSNQSPSNSFEFTEFFRQKNFESEKSLFNMTCSEYFHESHLLDSFVDRPISHKLPALKLPSLKLYKKFSNRSGFLDKSTPELKGCTITEEKQTSAYSCETSRKSSSIELKRNSNCSHSFSILFDKPEKSQTWILGSEDSFVGFGSKSDEKEKTPTGYSSSKEIILGLWEQEKSLIREFKPELAASFPALRMITTREFVEDVKYLFTGIDSETFHYDLDKEAFNMTYGTCLEDVTPESLFHFSKEFIEIGDYYVKLMSSVDEIGKNNFDTCTTISQAFWKSVYDYLELHYSLVLEIPVSTNLMALKSCTRDLYEIIKTVAKICRIKSKEPLPQGGELLTYLLQIAERMSRQCVINVVFGILQNCCSVYFMCILQKWMFRGQLECQNNEFFVDYHYQKGKMKSRTYYNSFFLDDEKIPSFLRGSEESIYNCGKSIHFLKLFNAENTFCQMLEKGYYPKMQLCFSDAQLERLEEKFKSYEERVLKICGPRITIKMIKDEEKEKERSYLEYVKGFKILQEKQQKEAQLKQLEKAKAVKENQNKLLNEQMTAIEAEKERRKREKAKEKAWEEEEIKKANETRENLVNKEKNAMRKYYGDLMNDLDKQIIVSEARKDALNKIISNTGEDPDVINCNEPETDHEGNKRNQLDVNLNKSSFNLKQEVKESVKELQIENVMDNHSDSYKSESLKYDENSNPCGEPEENEEIEEKVDVRRSVSFRTVAAEEAVKNKCRILRSEFGITVPEDPKPPKPPKPMDSMSDLEKNRQRVLESEYNILLKTSESYTSVTSDIEHARTVIENPKESKEKADDLKTQLFKKVDLERKSEYTDLYQSIRKKEIVESKSSSSSLTEKSSNEFSENPSSTSSELKGTRSSSAVLNEKYQDALLRDVEIFHNKSSQQSIFCCLKEEEDLDNLPCTEFFKFQRYLKKSAVIPLRAQEKLANDALLKHLLKGENLLSHLNSLRGYFFLNDGEFGRSFTHHVFRSLAKCTEPKQFFERSNLSNIVNEALNYTIHNLDPNSQNLSFRIVKMPPFLNHSSHDVLSPFELSYRVDWPLNFILTEKTLTKYKMVFKFLLKLKRINWTLNENFLHLNAYFKNKRLNRRALVRSSHYHKIQIFRHAMTQVMITLDDYIFSNGVQLPWILFLKDLETTKNIDHLYQKHVRYIKDVLTRCFLSNNSEDLLDCIHNLIELALKFHYTTKSSGMELENGIYEHPKFSVLKATFGEFCSVIKTFLKTLKEKISANEVLRSHHVLIEKFDLKLT